MDPLVRSTLAVQELLLKTAGIGSSLALGAYLVAWAARPWPPSYNLVVLGLALSSALVHLVRRLRRIGPEASTRLDLELGTSLAVLVYLGVLLSPGGLGGAAYPVVYAFLMLVAAFARPAAAGGTLCYALFLEAALHYYAPEHAAIADPGLLQRFLIHAGLSVAFTFLNMVLFRGEIARIRRLSRTRIEAEIEKMREAARSYRLLSAPGSNGPGDDEERLLRSSVDEIHQALEFALRLLQRSLKLESAVLFGLDASQSQLCVQEAASDAAILPGPLSAKNGIFAAALAQGRPVSIVGTRAAHHAVYYVSRPAVGALCAVPVLDRGRPRGVLVVDRAEREPFTSAEEESLLGATRFLLRVIENERVFVQLERAKIEQTKLYRAVEALAAAATEAQVIEAGVNSAREFASFDLAVVTLFDPTTGVHELCAASGPGADELVGQRFSHNSGLVSMVVANRHPLPYRGEYDPSRQVVFTRQLKPPEMPSLLVLPLLVHERALGTLVLGSTQSRAFSKAVRPTLEILASHVAVSLANARMLKRLEELATTDGLTGLLNKRALGEAAVQKLRSAHRFKKPLSVLICDIDHFKQVNDTYGHDVGDVVIRGFGDVLRRIKRDTDLVGRFGGEEFVFVCEETNSAGAEHLAERVRAELAATVFQTELGALKVTCSVGVATYPAAGARWETLFKAADDALYASKRNGRNRVTVYNAKLHGCAA
jgi:diguanylate cyclase (GGDEF)-like protein